MNKENVLVVDDDIDWHTTIELMLEGQYELKFATDAAHALSLAREFLFALAILDQRIEPDVSGIQLLARLREIQPDLRAIVLTGYAEVKDAVESMLSGALYYLSKGERNLAAELRTRVAGALVDRVHSIAALLRMGESEQLEFKSSARWDVKLQRVNKEIEAIIVKTVAAFLNSYAGGVLLIGVSDDGKPVGLNHDYASIGRKDRDGFQAFLTKLLTDAYGKDVGAFLHLDFHLLDGNDICRVLVKPCAHPVYVDDEKFFLRIGNTTARLTTREAIEYVRSRWK